MTVREEFLAIMISATSNSARFNYTRWTLQPQSSGQGQYRIPASYSQAIRLDFPCMSALAWRQSGRGAGVGEEDRPPSDQHEAPVAGGFGGEVAAVVAREAFAWLDAPVERLGALDTPVPAAQALEEIFSPKARLLPALRALLAYQWRRPSGLPARAGLKACATRSSRRAPVRAARGPAVWSDPRPASRAAWTSESWSLARFRYAV